MTGWIRLNRDSVHYWDRLMNLVKILFEQDLKFDVEELTSSHNTIVTWE